MNEAWWNGLWAVQHYTCELIGEGGEVDELGVEYPGLRGLFEREDQAAAEAARINGQVEPRGFRLGGKEYHAQRYLYRACPYRPSEYASFDDLRPESDQVAEQVADLIRHGLPVPGTMEETRQRAETQGGCAHHSPEPERQRPDGECYQEGGREDECS